MTRYEDGMTALDRAIEELSAAYNSESRRRVREQVLEIFSEPSAAPAGMEEHPLCDTFFAKETLVKLLKDIDGLIAGSYAVRDKVQDFYDALTRPERELQAAWPLKPPAPPAPVTKAEKNGHRKGSRARGAAAGMGVGGGNR